MIQYWLIGCLIQDQAMRSLEMAGVEALDYGDNGGKAQKIFQWSQNSGKLLTAAT